MGNSNSGSLDFEYNIIASDYSPTRKLQDFLFGEFYEVKHNSTGDTLLLKVRTTDDQHKYQQIVESAYKRISLSHKNLSKINGFAGREATTPMSIIYKIYVYFEPLPRDLARTLKNRKTIFPSSDSVHPKFLPESQLTAIMTQLVDVLEYLQVNEISHGDIRPEACFMTDDGNILICDRKLIYEDEWSYAENAKEKNFLLSPAAFEAYVKQDKCYRENRHKGDVFSLGMTLLECATYKRSAHIYDWGSSPKINKELLLSRIADVQSRYSGKVSQLIMEMLKFEEYERPDFIRLKKWIYGTEPIGILSSCSSPRRKNESQANFKNNIGPKLVGFSNQTSFNGSNMAHYGKIPSKILGKDDLPVENLNAGLIIPHGNRKGHGGKEEEDEVIEFETEGTPNKNSYMDLNHTLNNRTNSNFLSFGSTPYIFEGKEYSVSNTTSYDYRAESESANGIKGINQQVPKTEQNYDNPFNKFQDPSSHNYISSTYITSNKDFISPTKPYSYERDSFLHTPSTETYSNYRSAGTQINSPSSDFNSSLRLHETKSYLPYQNETPVKHPNDKAYATQSSPSRDNYSSKFNDKQPEYSSSSQFLSVSPNQYSKQPSPTYSNTSHNSQLFSSPNKSLNGANKFENTLSIDLTGEPEQWRSLVADGITYSTVLSLGPNSPKVGGSNNDLFAQQLQSLSPSKSNLTGNFFSLHNRDSDAGSRTSIEQSDPEMGGFTPHFKANKSAFSKQGSLQTLGLAGLQNPELKSSFSSPNTMRDFEIDNSALRDSEVDDIFRKAMNRSKETFDMIRNRDNFKSSVNHEIATNATLLDRLGRDSYNQTYYKKY